MKLLVLNTLKSPLDVEDRENLVPGPDEVVVQLRAAALNRRDYWITQGMYPGTKLPVTLGSDGAGVIVRCGAGVDSAQVGREVVLNPGLDWGAEQSHQGEGFNILGMPRNGTLATEVVVPLSQIHDKPTHLDWQNSAALPLAGVTAWRALFSQGGLRSGETVLITGIGGGVATFALQFAVAAGAEVWVTSSSAEKIERAVELGAKGGFNYTAERWWEPLAGPGAAPGLIVDSAGGPGYGALLKIAAPGGRIVNYGATAGPAENVDLFKVFWKQLQLLGSTMGSPNDFAAMLDFVNEHQIVPVVDAVMPLEQVNDALHRMASSPQFGKYVLEIDQTP